jgi:F0F1-type ATP synthase assembly protein I
MSSKSGSEDDPSKKDPGGVGESYREWGPYLSLGLQLAASVLVFFFLGNWLDEKYGTKPTYAIIGSVLGFVGGFIKFYKTVIELGKKESSKREG